MSHWSIRWKWTLGNAAMLTLILCGFAGVMLVMVHRHLLRQADTALADELDELAEELRFSPTREQMLKRLDERFSVHSHYHFQITDDDGEVIFRSRFLTNILLPRPGRPSMLRGKEYSDISLPELGHFRLLTMAIRDPQSQPLLYQALSPRSALDREFRSHVWMVLTAGPLTLLVALAAGYFLAGRNLAPIGRITSTAEKISAERLDERLVIENPHDEMGRLAATLNKMFARLDRSIDEMRRFTADAAHELRSPIAVLRTETEVALRRPRSDAEYREVIAVIHAETCRLTELVDQLLTLSRHDAGLQSPLTEEVPIDALLSDVSERFQVPAQEKGVTLEIASIPAWYVLGDDVALSQLFFNLVDNAVKFTPAGGCIRLFGKSNGRTAQFVVEDTGCGIDSEHLPRLFERFYRVDPSRQQSSGGTGLGLSICKSIAETHGGSIVVESEIARGTRFLVTLPGAELSE
ncbi:MAG: HAMP domain-containing protein [Planctomycetaceae bacterium]|nr:HAMP domain-containing protein [Planctomycetales bacterium]MCB9874800.1 HAMP domain-containing protein [Planctomycetaceae bacterium]